MFVHVNSGPCKYGPKCLNKMCTFQHDNVEHDADEDFDESFDESEENEYWMWGLC